MNLTLSFTLPEIAYLFFIYAFLGWTIEVAYAAIKHGIYSNRGFLIGPLCPIYGCGACIILLILTPIKSNVLILFICSVLLTSTLEYLTGWFLEKKFHERWWDYSDDKFNIKGYICLEFSIIWGLACLLVVYLINPPIIFIVRKIVGLRYGFIPAIILTVILVIDMIISNKRVQEFAKNIRTIELMDEAIRRVSDSISFDIYKSTMESIDAYEEFTEQEDVAKFLKELEETRSDLSQKSAELGASFQDFTDQIREKREERLSNRNVLLADIENEITSKVRAMDEERKKTTASIVLEIKLRTKQRTKFMNEHEKSIRKYMTKIPGIENRHKFQ